MLNGYLKYVAVILGVLVVVAPVSAEDFEILGTLTIKPDRCKELPNLAETTWSGTVDVASGTGFQFDQPVEISITSQDKHLFSGYITRFDYYAPPEYWPPVPFYGVFLGCYQIRVASAHTVMFAELNETAEAASGYVFSTDPFAGNPSEVLTPNMAVLQMTRDIEY
jgi:hypothetical protein